MNFNDAKKYVYQTMKPKYKKDRKHAVTKPAGSGRKARKIGSAACHDPNFDPMVEAYDNAQTIKKYKKHFDDLLSGRSDIQTTLQKLSPEALIKLMSLMMSGSEKAQLEAAKDLLDRSGYGKVQKHAIASAVDVTSSKEELVSAILGLGKKTGAIEILDDEENND